MRKTGKWEKICIIAALAVLVAMGFAAQRKVPFMTDDELYGTNLVTEEPLHSLGDVVESQVWHFFNWGGRCVTHGVLQLTLMSGELCADILNLLMILLLTYMVCVVIQRRDSLTFLMVHAMIYALNANLTMSMLWQSGTANYVYSSVWILLFMTPFLRSLQKPGCRTMPFAAYWLVPIGLMAGWSNENMGPVCFLLALGVIIYIKKWKKRKIEGWMLSGVFSSFLGSVLVVAAPGNFVRSAAIPAQTIGDRLYSMLTAGTDYLLPSALCAVTVVLIKAVCLRTKPDMVQWALIIMAVLSYGAMVLSPHYPDRATFGTMILCIALSVSALGDIVAAEAERGRAGAAFWMKVLTACFWLCALGKLAVPVLYL